LLTGPPAAAMVGPHPGSTMKITDVEVIKFRTPTREHRTRWGKERWGEEIDAMSSITKISTDEGVSGYMEGGQ
jgi:hypothetical protein